MTLFQLFTSTLFLLLVNASTNASALKDYFIFSKGSTSSTSIAQIDPPQGSIDALSETDHLINQITYIAEQGSIRKKELIGRLREIWGTTDNNEVSVGVGRHMRLMLPVAMELIGICHHQQSERRYAIVPSLKVLIPLSANVQSYIKVGKSFDIAYQALAHPIVSRESLKTVIDGLEENVLKKSPLDQWISSQTLVGVGLLKKLSSRIACDVSVTGYTTRGCGNLYFISSVGLHYLWG